MPGKYIINPITCSQRSPAAKYPNEYVIFSAHWDHLGIGKPDAKGDSIYNGAADNASGTAALLQIARAFKSQPEKTRTHSAVPLSNG